MKRPKIYLAGGQQYSKDLGVGWRKYITEKVCEVGWDVFDPSLEENPIREKHGDNWKEKCNNHDFRFRLGGELIDYDYNILKKCQAMLVYWDKSAVIGGGTKSEITWSRQLGIPCYVVLDEQHTIEDLPVWTCGGIRYPENVFKDFDSFLTEFKHISKIKIHASGLRGIEKGKVIPALYQNESIGGL
jgi:hypothetical protein